MPSVDVVSALDNADIFYPVASWPQWARQALQNPHKNREDRFNLFVFLWKNGMEAWRAQEWVMYHKTYDTSAWKSMQDVVNHTKTREGRLYLRRIPMMDMELGRVDRDTNFYNE